MFRKENKIIMHCAKQLRQSKISVTQLNISDRQMKRKKANGHSPVC
jgi:hypothetical protein